MAIVGVHMAMRRNQIEDFPSPHQTEGNWIPLEFLCALQPTHID